VWDTATRQAYRTLRGPKGVVLSAVFSPDSRQVATSREDGTVILWDVETGNQLHVLPGHNDQVISARFSPDGRWVVSASADKTAIIWDATSGELVHRLTGHSGTVYNAEFSPDGGQVVTASEDGTARIWNSQKGELQHTLSGHSDEVWSAVFSPNGQWIATISKDATGALWDAATGQFRRQFNGHNAAIRCLAFSPDGRWVVTGGFDAMAYIWDVATGKQVRKLSGHKSEIRSVAFSPDGSRLVTASGDGTARIWDVTASNPWPILSGVYSAVYSPDGRRLVTDGADGKARIWDSLNGNLLYTLDHSYIRGIRADFSRDGKGVWALASREGEAQIWNSETGKLRSVLKFPNYGESDRVMNATFSPDGQQVVSISYDGTIRRWSVASGEQPQEYWSGVIPVLILGERQLCDTCVTFALDGHLIVAINEEQWGLQAEKITDVQLLHVHWPVTASTETLNAAVFSPDGRWFAVSSQSGMLGIWDVVEDKPLFRSVEPFGYPLAFSSDGKLLATTSKNGVVRLIDPPTGRIVHELVGHPGLVRSAVFSHNGKWVVTSGAETDGIARVWDTSSGKQQIALSHSDELSTSVFSPDSRHVATISGGTARILPVAVDDLVNLAQSRVQRLRPELTPEERKKYRLDQTSP
jgi:WD40 repeat protein